jgi:hypothetical protein
MRKVKPNFDRDKVSIKVFLENFNIEKIPCRKEKKLEFSFF